MSALSAPTYYGEEFVRVGASWEEGGQRWQELATATPGPANPKPYLDQLEILEQRGGPYADGIAEPLASLGRYYRRQGDYAEAVKLYRRAMHVVRINDGLYSDRQIPLLRELLVSYREAGDLESLDQRYDYFFRLFGSGKPPFTELRLRASAEYFRWQREALRRDVEGNSKRLLVLIDANQKLLDEIRQDVEVGFNWRKELAYSQLKNFYLLLQRYSPELQNSQLLTSRDYMGAQPLIEDLEKQRIDARVRSAPGQGAELLKQLSAEARLQRPVEQASIKLSLGDWYWWSGNKQRAAQAYASVVTSLRDAGENEVLQQWLGAPMELPDNGVFWVPEIMPNNEGPLVQATYNVSSRGKLTNLQARLGSGVEEVSLSWFRRKLSNVLFRPRWVSGNPEGVTGLQRQYQMLN
ncbi:MAG: tetratricopeptide repeat protein [Halioglobus sp.]